MDVLPLHLLGTHAQSFVALEKVPCHLPDRSVHLPQLGDLGFLAANFGHKMIDWCLCLCHTLLGLHCTRLLGLHCTRHREQHVKQDAKTLDNLFGENPQRIQNFLSIRHDSLERLNEDRAALKSGILARQKLLHVAQLANDTNRRYQSQTNHCCFAGVGVNVEDS